MKLSLSAIALLASAVAASASPQGTWPDASRDLPLGRPTWILVVPAVRDASGSIVLWDRASDWTKAWVVPKATPGGIRTVSISGDSEDQKVIHAEQLDNMSSEALKTLANKYAADAVAVVVRDSASEVAVAAWKRGQHATWEQAPPGADGRIAALSAIDVLFSGSGIDAPSADAGAVPDAGGPVSVLAQRYNDDVGSMEYRVRASKTQADALAATGSVRLTGSGDGTVDLVVVDGSPIQDVIASVQ